MYKTASLRVAVFFVDNLLKRKIFGMAVAGAVVRDNKGWPSAIGRPCGLAARGGGAICAEALPKFRPRNAGGQRGAAIPRRAGKRRDFAGASRWRRTRARPSTYKRSTRSAALREGRRKGRAIKNLNRNLFAWHVPFWGLMNGSWDLGVRIWVLGFGYWELEYS